MKTFNDLYPDYVSNWKRYYKDISDENCVIITDLNLKEIAPVDGFDARLTIMLEMQDLSMDGDIEIADQIWEAFTPYPSIAAGCIIFMDQIHLVYYFDRQYNFEDILSPVLKGKSVDYILELRKDSSWEKYFEVLSPDDFDRNIIENSEVVLNIKNQGDDLTKSRRIDFFIFLESENYAKLLKQELEDEKIGFYDFEISPVEDIQKENLPQVYNLQLKFSRNMSLDMEDEKNINFVTSLLVRYAKKYLGFFDGWETDLILKDDIMQKDCIVSRMIVDQNREILYCYRTEPEGEDDSGWTFLSGFEDDEYLTDFKNFDLMDLKDIVEIEPFIKEIADSPFNSSFEKTKDGIFVKNDDEQEEF